MKLREIQKLHEDLLKARDFLNNMILKNREVLEDEEAYEYLYVEKVKEETHLLSLASEAVCTEAQRLLEKDWK